MTIPVTCPSCLKRFSVSDQFAGRTGPCPSCQKPIKIPEKADEVVIHSPSEAGPKDSTGKKILNPIRRKEVKLGLPVILGASLSAVTVLAVAIGLGLSGDQPPLALLASAALLLALPLVFVGYWFLHDDELEGYRGRGLLIRCGICSAAFAALWAVYAWVPSYISGYNSMAEISGLDLVLVIPLMIAIGAAVSVAVFELEVVQGVLHYMLYFAVTFILAWLAGTQLASPLSGDASTQPPPAVTTPADVGGPKTPPPANQPPETTPSPASNPKVPNILQ